MNTADKKENREEKKPVETGSAGVSMKKDFFWNTLGSLTYAGCIALLAFLVMRIAGEEDGGIFGFGFSTFGQQMFIIAYFGIRPFQITDVKREYSFGDYLKARNLTCLCAAAAALFFNGFMLLTGTYTFRKSLIIFLLALFKIADGYADVYESECQRAGCLWRGGRELFFRSVFSSAVLIGTLLLSGNLICAALAGVIAQALAVAVFALTAGTFLSASRGDAPCEQAPAEKCTSPDSDRLCRQTFAAAQGAGDRSNDSPDKHRPSHAKHLQLLKSTLLLFISVFLDFYVFSGAKYAIDLQLDDAASGIFNILFMPTSVIYLVANFIIKPFLTKMAESFNSGDEAGFASTRRKIAWIIVGLTALACLCAALLGNWALGIFEWILGDAYTGQLTGRTGEFFLIILGGGMYALADLYYYVLVIRRQEKRIFTVYIISTLITMIAAGYFVKQMGLTGAAIIYTALMSLLLFGMKLGSMV